MRFYPKLLVALFLLSVAACPHAVWADVTDEQVGNAVERMKKYLYYKQDPLISGYVV